MPEEEEGFSFVDKRRSAPEGPPDFTPPESARPDAPTEPAPPESPQPESAPQEFDSSYDFEEADEELGSDSPPGGPPQLSVRDRIFMSIDILHQGAWIAMGLRADPATGEIEQDLEAARIAIDCVTFLTAKIEADLDDATRRELKRVVSDMQLNYVNQAKRAQQPGE